MKMKKGKNAMKDKNMAEKKSMTEKDMEKHEMPMHEMDDSEDEAPHEMELEGHARTLMEAEKIKEDEKLMKHLHNHFAKKEKHIKSIQELKKIKNDMFKKGS